MNISFRIKGKTVAKAAVAFVAVTNPQVSIPVAIGVVGAKVHAKHHGKKKCKKGEGDNDNVQAQQNNPAQQTHQAQTPLAGAWYPNGGPPGHTTGYDPD